MIQLSGEILNGSYKVHIWGKIATFLRKCDVPKQYRKNAVKLTTRFWSAWGISQFPTMLQSENAVLEKDDILSFILT